MRKLIQALSLIVLLVACSEYQTPSPAATQTGTSTVAVGPSIIPTLIPTSIYTSTPQPLPVPASFDPDSFPPGYNPLTGQPMIDLAWLKIPAVLVSISHFPPVARPQAATSALTLNARMKMISPETIEPLHGR